MKVIEILGSEEDIVSVEVRERIIEDILKEHKLKYTKVYTYDECREVEYKTRRQYHIGSEYVTFKIDAPESKVQFVWHLYCEFYSEMLSVMSCYELGDA